MKRLWFAVAALAGVVGCNTGPARMPSVASGSLTDPGRVPFDLALEYTSELKTPYYVTSGPAESYARYSISSRFRTLLEQQVADLTTPGSPRRATLVVRVTGLTTRYHQLGGSGKPVSPTGPRYADPWHQVPTVVPAAFSSPFERDDGNSDIPEEIHKGATLTAEVELRGDGFTPVRQTVTAVHDDLMLKWDFDRRRAYSYGEVLDKTLRAATGEITAIVRGALR